MAAAMVPSAALPTSKSVAFRGRRRAFAFLLPAALIALVAIGQVGAVACAEKRVPSERDWERAAAHVRERHVPDELIVFAPAWLDPVGRLHLGDRIPIEMAARMDAARYRAIWELSARRARAPETRGLEVAHEARFGDVRVRLYEQEPVVVVTDFVEALSTASVEGAWAQRPRVALEEVAFSPRRCVRAVPSPGGEGRIRFEGVALGGELVGYAGLADIFTLRDIREPGGLRVRIDGEEVAELELGIHDGWVRFAVATEPREHATVEFLASADVRDRLICFAAEARR
jgi:hypothetical protein